MQRTAQEDLARPLYTYYEGVPDYLVDVYDWAYVNPDRVRSLDRNLVVRTLLFLQDRRLMRRYLERIRAGSRVWQVAHVYGDLVIRAAHRVGPHGVFHLSDITPIQLEQGLRKLSGLPWAKVFRADAGQAAQQDRYDLVCSFFLLHEVPDDKKRQIVDCMLSKLAPGGEAVFVDYHRPRAWQPIGWLLRLVNAWLEPYAHALWQHEISEYASDAAQYRWEKRTLFGGVYQCVVARRT
ncbi:rhodoquinone biosynthesis methyltransferase RquA [Chitiniphilus purpureus]|uniref:Rhodoquinone biosynthesis methyltransferase RquA n=1 Tax=Chitiniphilus purpureus TaxID=2981137 RepID=A0ABY6DSG0_9NEIS|nr:rhodoquinone biosynthesis methyltransferase RquA [Chitiniphilus sp. CD1]UXY16658.1 rhodoquinone biosynthesis methyltransferase RquA [Chitiniphilus sp. CD1]